MKIGLIVALLVISNFAFSGEKFGENFSALNSIDIKNVLQDKSYLGKEIVVKGEVEKLCMKKGCWLNLKADGEVVRVTFKDYGIFVPNHFLGTKVALKGIANIKEESIERQKHLMSDEGLSRSEIDKIRKPKKTYSFIATGIERI